jgi:sec-independent protein translocase protein TatA
MGGLSVWHWLIFLVVALLLFGGSGKISSIMGDVAKGIKSFKKGMTEDDAAAAPAAPPPADPFKRDEPRAIDSATARPAETAPVQQRPTGS